MSFIDLFVPYQKPPEQCLVTCREKEEPPMPAAEVFAEISGLVG